MGVRKYPGTALYGYRFQLGGKEYHGPTGCPSRREAEAVERKARDKAKAERKAARNGVAGLTFGEAALRYYNEAGQYLSNAKTLVTDFSRMADYLGKDKLLTDITTEDLTRLIAWRRQHMAVKGGKAGKNRVAAATVNRTVLKRLQRLFNYAKENWDARFDNEPRWKGKKLAEPVECVRELQGDESDRIDAAMRADYAPFFEYVRLSGQRRNECLLRWDQVNWESRLITRLGKGRQRTTVPITDAIREILWPLRGDHPVWVFTYVAQRPWKPMGLVRGQRYPMTLSGVKTAWRRLRARAKLGNFRFHDFRHDYATKMLRATGNLKIVQKALNHSNIATTTKYAHVLVDDVAAAADMVQRGRKNLAERLADRAKRVG